jgi:hypothetical protein
MTVRAMARAPPKSPWGITARIVLLASLVLTVAPCFAGATETCGAESTETGREYKVIGWGHNIREGPGTSYDKIVDEKASRALKKTKYITIDDTVTVYEECTVSDWSRIRVVEPAWFTDSHRGWVPSNCLDKGD